MTETTKPRIDIERLQSGDAMAFEQVVHLYYPRVYRLALRLLGVSTDAEDIAQETFLRIHRRVSRFRAESSLATWIYRIAHNLCVDELRRRRRRPALDAEPLARDLTGDGGALPPSPEEALLLEDESARVRRALAALPPVYRSVLILREVEDLSYEQIAAILRCPVGTVRSRLARGRRLLAEELQRREQSELQEDPKSTAAL